MQIIVRQLTTKILLTLHIPKKITLNRIFKKYRITKKKKKLTKPQSKWDILAFFFLKLTKQTDKISIGDI